MRHRKITASTEEELWTKLNKSDYKYDYLDGPHCTDSTYVPEVWYFLLWEEE